MEYRGVLRKLGAAIAFAGLLSLGSAACDVLKYPENAEQHRKKAEPYAIAGISGFAVGASLYVLRRKDENYNQ